MRRIVYLSAFVALSGIAGMLYYSHTQQSTAVVATRDLPVGTRIQDADLAVRRVNPASVGPQVLTTVGAALGQVVAFPVLAGQMLDARQVAPSKNAALLGSGLQVPQGYRIIGLLPPRSTRLPPSPSGSEATCWCSACGLTRAARSICRIMVSTPPMPSLPACSSPSRRMRRRRIRRQSPGPPLS